MTQPQRNMMQASEVLSAEELEAMKALLESSTADTSALIAHSHLDKERWERCYNKLLFKCDMCDIERIVGYRNYESHLKGRKHIMKLKQKQADGGESNTSGEPQSARVSEVDEDLLLHKEIMTRIKEYCCSICNLQCYSMKDLNEHLESLAHAHMTNRMVMAAVNDPAGMESEPESGSGKYYCELCNNKCLDIHGLEKHLNGKVHHKKLQQLGLEGLAGTQSQAKKETTPLIKSIAQLRSVEQPLVGLQYLTEIYNPPDPSVFECSLCVTEKGPHVIDTRWQCLKPHLVSRKHRITYMRKHYKKFVLLIEQHKMYVSEEIAMLEEYARVIEAKEGRAEVRVSDGPIKRKNEEDDYSLFHKVKEAKTGTKHKSKQNDTGQSKPRKIVKVIDILSRLELNNDHQESLAIKASELLTQAICKYRGTEQEQQKKPEEMITHEQEHKEQEPQQHEIEINNFDQLLEKEVHEEQEDREHKREDSQLEERIGEKIATLKHETEKKLMEEELPKNIIFATDSRGANIEAFVNENSVFENNPKQFVVIPNGKIELLKGCIEDRLNLLPQDRPTLVVFAAGIYNIVTEKIHDGGKEVVYLRSTFTNNYIMRAFANLLDYFKDANNVQIKIAFIPPISLPKNRTFNETNHVLSQSQFSWNQILEQQKQLEDDIDFINTHIAQLNYQSFLRNIQWDKQLKSSKKTQGRKGHKMKPAYTYEHLFDGIHPDMQLMNTWCRFVCLSVNMDLTEPLMSKHAARNTPQV